MDTLQADCTEDKYDSSVHGNDKGTVQIAERSSHHLLRMNEKAQGGWEKHIAFPGKWVGLDM